MRLSPLHLEYYFVKKLQFAIKEGFDREVQAQPSEVSPPRLQVSVHAEHNDDNSLRWRFELSIESNDETAENFPYTFGVTLVGLFRIDEGYPADNAEMLARVNAPSVLYSAAREMLTAVTGRGLHPAILLPSASFVPVQESDAAPPDAKSSGSSRKSSKRKRVPADKSSPNTKPSSRK